VFPTFAVGGAQARLATIAGALGGRYRHLIVALDGRLDARARLDPRLDVTCLGLDGVKNDMIRAVRTYAARLAEWRPDLTLTYNWGAIEFAAAARFARLPQMHVIDGFGPEEVSRRLRRRLLISRLALARALVVVPSRKLLTICRDEMRLPAAQALYLPNGINLDRFSPAAKHTARPLTIGTIAALRAEKNIDRLIHAFSHLDPVHNARLLIVGDGERLPSLTALVAALGLGDRVTFAGHHNDVRPLLQSFDICALSSDTEQMPMVVLEAMASGLPIAATDVGDIATMVAPENAPFVRGRHFAPLAAALAELCRDAQARARIGAANRAQAEAHFTEAGMVTAWERALRTRLSTAAEQAAIELTPSP
jgi:glycosyltransferase involved in cell wall biosynthesis